jgi:hypothetical protein
MSRTNSFDTPPGKPDGSDHQARDALDDIDEAVAQITDNDIEDRLRETLRRAGYDAGGPTSPGSGVTPSRGGCRRES